MVPIKFYLDLIPTPDSDLTLQLHGALKSGGYQKGHQTYLSWPTTVATSAARVAPYIFKTTIIARGHNCRAVGGGGCQFPQNTNIFKQKFHFKPNNNLLK